jgi:hypothetical protein
MAACVYILWDTTKFWFPALICHMFDETERVVLYIEWSHLRGVLFINTTELNEKYVIKRASKQEAIWFVRVILIRLPSVFMFFLFCIIVKRKIRCHNMKPRKKVTNERESEYDISVAFPFSAVTISKPQQKWANQCAWSGVRVTDLRLLSCKQNVKLYRRWMILVINASILFCLHC